MARIYVESLADFKTAVQLNCNATTHIVVSDEATYVVVVPVVTSQHRHYIILQGVAEDEIGKALSWLKDQGFKIVRGRIEFQS